MTARSTPAAAGHRAALAELASLFFVLGTVGFGGPAAHLAMMEEAVVRRRGWLPRERFLDLLGVTNLIPGPNSTEMAMQLGYARAGYPGLVVAGAAFIVPAVLLTTILAWVYVRVGRIPEGAAWLAGAKPAVLAVLLAAIVSLGRGAAKTPPLLLLGVVITGAALLGASETLLLLGGGVVGLVGWWLRRPGGGAAAAGVLPLVATGIGAAWASSPVTPTAIGLYFLQVGAVLYGSGYVLFAFLEGGLVDRLGWLDRATLLDAIAVGQLTPGPVLSTATFVGYLLDGMAGAVAATIGIFLPSFVFVGLLAPLVPRVRRAGWMGAFLDAVNVSAVGLMAAVAVELALATLTTWPTALILAAGLAGSVRWRIPAPWIVVGGMLLGRVLPAP
ncbi:MAG TPA: chromate efflux transporter [Gemmatimonadales bacterium]|nr:chromate efflux transporter [Gemmatimonadales bacterium]